MEKDFCIGLLMGLAGGALICANSYKARRAVKEGQDQVLDMLNDLEHKKDKMANKNSIEQSND